MFEECGSGAMICSLEEIGPPMIEVRGCVIRLHNMLYGQATFDLVPNAVRPTCDC